MSTNLDEQKVNIRVKLAGLWTSFMILYTYVDDLHLYMPGSIENIFSGRVLTTETSYVFLLLAMIFVVAPVFMIFISTALNAKASRKANIIVASLYVPYMLFNFGALVEVALLLLIISYAWRWPELPKSSD